MTVPVQGLPPVTADGFLLDSGQWDEQVAAILADQAGITLTEKHWEIIRFIRQYYLTFEHLPNMRMFVKALQKELGADKGQSAYLHQLFPQSPLKYACLIAGTPKPPGCI